MRTWSGWSNFADYRSADCTNRPFKTDCTKAKGKPKNPGHPDILTPEATSTSVVKSEEGYQLSVRRIIEPESVFGQLKSNRDFQRFLLRGLPIISLEVGVCPQSVEMGKCKRKGTSFKWDLTPLLVPFKQFDEIHVSGLLTWRAKKPPFETAPFGRNDKKLVVQSWHAQIL